MKLYRNLGNGAFRDVTAETGLDKVFMPMGANFGDIDNDGYPDIYLGTGDPSYSSLLPNVLLHNQEGKRFVDITASSGTGELHKGHGVAFADIDNDGDEDILTVIGGATPGDSHAFRLFENPGHGNDWIAVKLVGVKSQSRGHRRQDQGHREDRRAASRDRSTAPLAAADRLARRLSNSISGWASPPRIVALEIRWPGTEHTAGAYERAAKSGDRDPGVRAPTSAPLARKPVRLGGARGK